MQYFSKLQLQPMFLQQCFSAVFSNKHVQSDFVNNGWYKTDRWQMFWALCSANWSIYHFFSFASQECGLRAMMLLSLLFANWMFVCVSCGVSLFYSRFFEENPALSSIFRSFSKHFIVWALMNSYAISTIEPTVLLLLNWFTCVPHTIFHPVITLLSRNLY